MKISIDEDLCIGCSVCSTMAPDSFELGDDAKAHVKKGEHDEAKVKDAADNCPQEAIKIE